MQLVKRYEDWMYKELRLSPCSGYNPPDEIPVRCEQIDIAVFNTFDEIINKHPREKLCGFFHRHVGRKNRTILPWLHWLDGSVGVFATLGQYPRSKGERAVICAPLYNQHDRLECECGTDYHVPTLEHVTSVAYTNYTLLGHFAFHLNGGFWRMEDTIWGSNTVVVAAALNHVIQSKPPYNDEKIFELWEEAKWRKAKIRRLKALKRFLREPTLLNLRRAELEAAKADYWPYRRLVEVRWPDRYLSVWEIKQEIKRLKKDAEAKARRAVGELFKKVVYLPKPGNEEVMFQPLHPEGKVVFKLIGELSELEDEIRKEKERIKETRHERRRLMRKMQRLIKEAIKRYPAQIKEEKASLRAPRERLYRKALKEQGRIIEYLGAKENLIMLRDMVIAKHPLLRDKRIYFVSVKPWFAHICAERRQEIKLRGDYWEEELYPIWFERRWHRAHIRRDMKGSCKVRWLGSLVCPTLLSLILSNDSQGDHQNSITRLVFRMRHQNRGMGEWKVLSRDTRKKISYPLMIRPIRLKNGHVVYGQVFGAEECRPLRPPDIWRCRYYSLWACFFLELLNSTGLHKIVFWNSTRNHRYRRPFVRFNFSYNFLDRIVDWFILNVW